MSYISSTADPVTTNETDCYDGEIRLRNGSNVLEGRVEVCYSNAWGTLCDNGFGQVEAEVVCRQLDSQFGYLHGSSTPYREAHFGEGVGPIFIDNLACEGAEANLTQCGTVGCDRIPSV